jgi:phage terminase large subunit-like protein
MKSSAKAIRFLETLAIPEGPKAGELIGLAPFQKKFVRGALADDVNVAVLSIGRGNAKTALSAGIALGSVMGKWDEQPRSEILIAARTRGQARIAFDFVVGFMRSLPEDEQKLFTVRRSPLLEIEYEGDGGGHFIRVIVADGKFALGSAPTMLLMEKNGPNGRHWSGITKQREHPK